jgi:hypothetical protein
MCFAGEIIFCRTDGFFVGQMGFVGEMGFL